MGRIFTAFLFIIIPFVKLFADTSTCDINSACSCFTDSSTCSSAPGCYYVSNSDDEFASGECKACDQGDDSTAGRYGPGCNSQCDSITDSSNSSISDFRFGHQHMDDQNNAIRGARTKYECYKKLDEPINSAAPATGHGKQCIGRDGYVADAREYYRDGASDRNTVYYYDTGTGHTSLCYRGNSVHHFVTLESSGDVGVTSDCSDYELDPDGFHMERVGDIENSKCYANKLTNAAFGAYIRNSNTSIGTCISGTGYLNYEHHHLNGEYYNWRLDGDSNSDAVCVVPKSNEPYGVYNGTHVGSYICNVNNLTYRLYTGTWVSGATVSDTKLYYSDGPKWSCVGCKPGYVGFFKYNSNNDSNYDGLTTCEPAAKGCYSDGCGTGYAYTRSCSSDTSDILPNSSYFRPTENYRCLYISINSESTDPFSAFYHPCYAGMTTANVGAESRNECYYTDQTRFCDAWGCTPGSAFNLPGSSTWKWYINTETVGSTISDSDNSDY